jgi:hypothetical protein
MQLSLFDEPSPQPTPERNVISTKAFKYRIENKELIITHKSSARTYTLTLRGWFPGTMLETISKELENAKNTVIIYHSRKFFLEFMTADELLNEYQQVIKLL